MEFSPAQADLRLCSRVKTLVDRLEAANQEVYESVRSEIVLGGCSLILDSWLLGAASEEAQPGLGFDLRDEIVSGVLQLGEPEEQHLPSSPEMVPYQPTPARHILDLITASELTDDDILVDLGSGLGHVPLLVSILTGARTLGVEFQPAYVATAQECVGKLNLRRTLFLAGDACEADLSGGTVFYLFSPFTGSILSEVLQRLKKESTERAIRICSLGPCTCVLEDQAWLKPNAPPDTGRITVFKSQ